MKEAFSSSNPNIRKVFREIRHPEFAFVHNLVHRTTSSINDIGLIEVERAFLLGARYS